MDILSVAVHPLQPLILTGDVLGRIDQWLLLDSCLGTCQGACQGTCQTPQASQTSQTTRGRRSRVVELSSPVRVL